MKIDISKLKKSFNDQQVLDIDNLSFDKGLTCIMGTNGCGKTTLLNILSGHLDYDHGSVRYNDRQFHSDVAQQITLVHQRPYLFNRSVFENIAYPLRVRGVKGPDLTEQVEAIIRKFKIEKLKDKNGTRLSGGESQKVALARALVFEPDFLMLDESMSHIDRQSTEVIEEIICSYADRGKTVLFVTHDHNQAEQITPNIIRL